MADQSAAPLRTRPCMMSITSPHPSSFESMAAAFCVSLRRRAMSGAACHSTRSRGLSSGRNAVAPARLFGEGAMASLMSLFSIAADIEHFDLILAILCGGFEAG